jgi:hypothetical protein
MIENDLVKLNEQEPRRSLDMLESDIWAGVAARANAKRTSRLVFTCQAVVMALALTGSIAAGNRTALLAQKPTELGVFSSQAELAPSTLLASAR